MQLTVYRDVSNTQREEAPNVMITIDYKDRRPLYQQLMEKIEELALNGLIQADEQLPSVRSLAVELAINPNTIQRAYGELEKKGHCLFCARSWQFFGGQSGGIAFTIT